MLHFKQGHLEVENYHKSNMKVKSTHVLQYKTAPFPTLSRPASRSAFSSAWMHRHSSKPSIADGPPSLHRLQPPSVQFGTLRGVPLYLQVEDSELNKTIEHCILYPVAMIVWSRVRIAPTRRFMQFERCDASDASFYSPKHRFP